MLKKDINKLLKVKTEIDKFTGNYINSKGFTVQKKQNTLIILLTVKI